MEQSSARERIIKERVNFLVRRPFFGYLALGLELKEAPELVTQLRSLQTKWAKSS